MVASVIIFLSPLEEPRGSDALGSQRLKTERTVTHISSHREAVSALRHCSTAVKQTSHYQEVVGSNAVGFFSFEPISDVPLSSVKMNS